MKQNYKKNVIALVVIIGMSIFSSCGRMFYGSYTEVNIDSNISKDSVSIIAMGPRDVVEYNNVSFPYKMKVKRNNLPLKVNVLSKDYDYDQFEIRAKTKTPVVGKIITGVGALSILTATVMSPVVLITQSSSIAGVCLAGVVGGFPLMGIGFSFEHNVPVNDLYYTMADTINPYTYSKTNDAYRRELVTMEIYKNLDAKNSLMEVHNYIDWLQDEDIKIYGKKSAESHYLRGLAYLKDDYPKKAQKEFNAAIDLIDVSDNPGLYDNIIDCILEVEEIDRQKRARRAEIWTDVANMVLQTGVATYQAYAQAENLNNMQRSGITPSGVVTDPSKISPKNLNHLIDPYFVAQQVSAREYAEYQEFCRYNKREDGSNYSFDDFQAYKGQLLLNLKEQGIDVVAEQKELNAKLRQQMREDMYKDTERRFNKMGYNYNSPISNSNSNSNNSNTNQNITNYSTNSNMINSTSASSQVDITYGIENDSDSKEQYRRDSVASEDYKVIRKDITLYYRDGDKAVEYKRNVTLYKKGSNFYIKFDNTFYPRRAPNWLRFRNMIHYREGLYYND